MNNDCIFCQIANKELPKQLHYESDLVVAFDDLHKDAPEHVVIISKKHIATLNDALPADRLILGELLLAASQIAAKLKIDQSGYRCLINTGANGGQVIQHLHLHLVGGRPLGPLLTKSIASSGLN
ncbi:MAG: histidine triad nucleotide-binding protein [bacterium]|nr:histidine triad nucleotide-binding protein [bacterium]